MDRIFMSDLDEIHSFNSYFGEIVRKDDSITIPYVNLGVSEHPLHKGRDLKYIDIAYMVFEGVLSFEERYSLDHLQGYLTLYFGGYDVVHRKNREFKIVCRSAYLRLLQDSKLSDQMWLPIKASAEEPSRERKKMIDFLGMEL